MQAIKRARIKSHPRKALRDGTCEASSMLSLLLIFPSPFFFRLEPGLGVASLDFMDIAAHRKKIALCSAPFHEISHCANSPLLRRNFACLNTVDKGPLTTTPDPPILLKLITGARRFVRQPRPAARRAGGQS
jgi:hypothetical protein